MRIPAIVLTSAFVIASAPAFAQSHASRGTYDDEEMVHTPLTTPPPAWTQRSVPTVVPSGGDAQLVTQVESRLARLPNVDLSGIQIHAMRGAIRLSGLVNDEATRERILIATHQLDGVAVVRDEMSLRAPDQMRRGGGPIDDSQIAQATRAAIAHDPYVAGHRIMTTSTQGVVTLSGHVATWHDAERLVQDARSVANVRSVQSNLDVAEGGFMDANGHRLPSAPGLR